MCINFPATDLLLWARQCSPQPPPRSNRNAKPFYVQRYVTSSVSALLHSSYRDPRCIVRDITLRTSESRLIPAPPQAPPSTTPTPHSALHPRGSLAFFLSFFSKRSNHQTSDYFYTDKGRTPSVWWASHCHPPPSLAPTIALFLARALSFLGWCASLCDITVRSSKYFCVLHLSLPNVCLSVLDPGAAAGWPCCPTRE